MKCHVTCLLIVSTYEKYVVNNMFEPHLKKIK